MQRFSGRPHAWNCAICFASFVGGAVPPQGRPQAAGRSSQFQPGKYEIFSGRGMSNPFFDSQKPAKPGKRGLIWQGSLGLAGVKEVKPFSGRPPGLLLCFVCGRGSASTRLPPATQFQPGKYEIFPGRGCPMRKPARSQPNLFFDSQKPAKPGKRGLIWQGSLGLAGS